MCENSRHRTDVAPGKGQPPDAVQTKKVVIGVFMQPKMVISQINILYVCTLQTNWEHTAKATKTTSDGTNQSNNSKQKKLNQRYLRYLIGPFQIQTFR